MSDAVGVEVRRCPVKGYAMWFTIDDTERIVDVIAFLHGRQDTLRHLGWRF